MAMPTHKPTPQMREQVERMAGFGFTIEQIALALDIGERTLYKYYENELKRGHVTVNVKVVGKLFAATQRNDKAAVTAQIFWTKTRMGWRESPSSVELTGAGGGPVQAEVTADDAFKSIASALESAAAGKAGSGKAKG